jgi:hypothetical protein
MAALPVALVALPLGGGETVRDGMNFMAALFKEPANAVRMYDAQGAITIHSRTTQTFARSLWVHTEFSTGHMVSGRAVLGGPGQWYM